MEKPDESILRVGSISAALNEWRQGDCVVGEQWFSYRLSCTYPVTEAAKAAAKENFDLAETLVKGLVVTSQTCDILRDFTERPFVDVSPLVEIVDPLELANIKKGRCPRYAYIPGISASNLVGDLERSMCVEKPVLAGWQRIQGCSNDRERRSFAWMLARLRSRFAFPDDFVHMMRHLRSRFIEKHGKSSPEGEALRALSEVRICATPHWDAIAVGLHYWFIRNEAVPEIGGKSWAEHLKSWDQFLKDEGRFKREGAVVVTLNDLTAQEYLDSDPLELEHLSMAASA